VSDTAADEAQSMEFNVTVEKRDDGFYTNLSAADYASDKWIGPYPSEDEALAAAERALENVVADLVKATLGLL